MGWDRNNVDAWISRASQLLESFEFTGSMEDLDAAIKELQQISSLLLHDDNCQSRVLNNLGAALTRRGERLNSLNDIQAGIKALQATLRFFLVDPHERGKVFINIGTGWMNCYDRFG